jgi:hypothetical protein
VYVLCDSRVQCFLSLNGQNSISATSPHIITVMLSESLATPLTEQLRAKLIKLGKNLIILILKEKS